MALWNWINRLLAPTPVAAAMATPVATPSPADWDVLCTSLCKAMDYADCDGLSDEVHLAREDPSAYFAQHADDLGNRGIVEPAHVTTWLALVDGLQRRDLNVEVDWKVDLEELVLSLATLQMATQQKLRFGTLASGDSFGEAALAQASAWLQSRGIALVSLDINSDCYPLSLMAIEEVALLQPLVAQVGEKLVVL